MTEIRVLICQDEIEMLKAFADKDVPWDVNENWDELRSLLKSLAHIVIQPGFDEKVSY